MSVFVFFLYFLRIFGARPRVGDFVIFSYFFRISGLEGFLSSRPGTRDHKPDTLKVFATRYESNLVCPTKSALVDAPL